MDSRRRKIILRKIFTTLEDWRHLPNYQLERRTDIFFALYLDRILEEVLNVQVQTIIPELPVRNATINPKLKGNRSFKVDYAVFDKNHCYLVELKTDNKSVDHQQLRQYRDTTKAGFAAVMTGILTIADATKEKDKYNYLLKKLTDIGAIEGRMPTNQYAFSPEPIIIKPTGEDDEHCKVINFDTIIGCLEKERDELASLFAQALAKWRKPA